MKQLFLKTTILLFAITFLIAKTTPTQTTQQEKIPFLATLTTNFIYPLLEQELMAEILDRSIGLIQI